MKVAYIVNFFPKLSETVTLGRITDLIDRGYDVEVISINRPTEELVHEDINKYKLLGKTHYINKSLSENQLTMIRERIRNLGVQLSKLGTDIRLKTNELNEKNKELNRKDKQITNLQKTPR